MTQAQCVYQAGQYQGDNTTCTPNPCGPRTGACCHADGTCTALTAAECLGYGWTFQGDNSLCIEVNCAAVTGACCIGTDSCEIMTQAQCTFQSGQYQGDNTSCTPNPCGVRGACCIGTDSCEIMTQAQCTFQSGQYQGDNTSCTPNPCGVRGACCIGTDSCEIMTQAQCEYQAGQYRGDGTTCTPNPCGGPPQTGACCVGSQCIANQTLQQCVALTGAWIGPGSVCGPGMCGGGGGTGACCLPDGTCQVTTAQQCSMMNGTYHGDGSACGPTTCPQVTQGACCMAGGGACFVMTSMNCGLSGGMYQGDGTTCGPTTCPQPPQNGRCCLSNGACTETTMEDCGVLGGMFAGPGTTCAGDPCAQPPGDFQLQLPLDGAVDVPVAPLFDWNDAAGVVDYDLYVDDDPAIGSPEIAAANLLISQYQAPDDALQPATTYYWTVIAYNASGETQSSTHSFTTGAAAADCNSNGVPDLQDIADGTSQDCNGNAVPDECDIVAQPGAGQTIDSGPLNMLIPENLPPGISHAISVAETAAVYDLNAQLSIDHTWVGDLVITLTHGGTSVVLIDRPGRPPGSTGFGCGADNYVAIVLDDEGAGGAIENMCVMNLTSPPSYTPNNPLSALVGASAAGDWILTVSDNASGDFGILVSWSLLLTPGSPPVSMDANGNGVPDECE
ncbi:Proprotein convertase P-domain protein [Phycisphaerae bacterium RAS1]|nr:Proprotein convertase P-domain protein [Phycisphaerae bacterium RAS1]